MIILHMDFDKFFVHIKLQVQFYLIIKGILFYVMDDQGADINISQRFPPLPDGKRYHFFIVAADEDRHKVSDIVSHLRESFQLKCLFEAEDCKPGQDKFEFMKNGMMQSVKVVLFLSKSFAKDEMCRYQRRIAVAASVDARIQCIVPVLLEEVDDDDETSIISNLTFVNAESSETTDVSRKIAESVACSDLYATMFPGECTNVFARFENGYSVEIPVRRDKLRCNRPARYRFRVDREVLNLLKDSQMKVPENLLKDIVKFVNKESIMKYYDCLKKRNICCWGFFLMMPICLLFGVMISLIVILSTCSQDRPDPETFVFDFSGILLLLGGVVAEVHSTVLIAMILAVPKLCHREKKDIAPQTKICSRFLRRCIENDIIIVFSGRKDRRPSLRVVRYNFGKCRGKPITLSGDQTPLFMELHASTRVSLKVPRAPPFEYICGCL
ncbi:uncharacterized protein LOC123536367 isoform X2 [Mercenaria mercenaria]|uniref:uncharacterized protein LOC123536367 isoform X2 n=1 Tax=Mercenaria mercenaria TaxID=6596 RepID=UPI00234F2C97|nr:uncharacterized protein LOC123536367 isoform X2 [Mercenaria mercenaria]